MWHRKRPAIVGLTAALVALAFVPAHLSAADPEETAGDAVQVSLDESVEIAIDHVRDGPGELGVAAPDVGQLRVASAYTSSHNEVTHVNLSQRFRDLEVFGAYATVNVASDGNVVFVGHSLVEGLRIGASGSVDTGAIDAVEAAAEALDLDEPEDLRVLSRRGGPARRTVLSEGGISEEPIPARVGWQPTEEGLRLAWQLVIDDVSDVHVWNATVDAETGDLLAVDDWTDHDSLEDLESRLMRSGGDTSAALQNLSSGPTVFESANPVEDGSSYRVFPQESPDDGDRVLSTTPADGTASPFGWHDVSGTPEPDFTITQGNNVHAYTDRDANNQPDPGSEPDGGQSLTFDFPMDLNEHPQTYVPAGITNLFWWCNINHDLFYLYGFDEPSGNFQVNNYGRGGVGGDDVRCEGMDGSGHNNANFSTPAMDGGRPRMQTMIELGTGLPSAVTVDSGPAAGTYLAHYARFSPAATTAGIPGTLVLVDDGIGNPNDGCQPYTLPAGAIAVVDTTNVCNNYTQTVNAEAAGAVALVVVHTANTPTFMSGSMEPPVGIPAVRVGLADGNAIKAAISVTPAPGSVHRNTARPPMRVGELDTATIIHEYSHGVSNRLTGGPTTNCLTGEQRMGEGWSDYHAIAALIDTELDDPDGPRGIFPYVVYQPPRTSAGLRPRPYSRNMEIQPATYDSIRSGGWLNGATLSMPHGVGHVWAAFLWDMTWDLIEKLGFNPNLYDDWNTGGNNLAFQLVMDGLKFQGCGPSFIVGRDAIIAAEAALTGGENACTLWASFARRGLGYSASDGGTTNRNDNTEAFDTHPDCLRGFLAPVSQPYGQLHEMVAGDARPLRFTADGHTSLDVLASNSPFSRQVDCDTLAVVSETQFVTPRARPVPTETPGNTRLTVNARGQYMYPWQTLEEWAGSCRELVLTRTDGAQHRAFFRFVEG